MTRIRWGRCLAHGVLLGVLIFVLSMFMPVIPANAHRPLGQERAEAAFNRWMRKHCSVGTYRCTGTVRPAICWHAGNHSWQCLGYKSHSNILPPWQIHTCRFDGLLSGHDLLSVQRNRRYCY